MGSQEESITEHEVGGTGLQYIMAQYSIVAKHEVPRQAQLEVSSPARIEKGTKVKVIGRR